MEQVRERTIVPPWIGYLAAAWAAGHGLMSVYWALGGTAGTPWLSESAREQSASGEFAVVVWTTAAVKFAAALVAIAFARGWPLPGLGRRLLLFATWLGAAGLVLYGVLGIAVSLAVVTGFVDVGDEASATVRRAYLLLWYPLWLLGGLLFLATAMVASRRGESGLEASEG